MAGEAVPAEGAAGKPLRHTELLHDVIDTSTAAGGAQKFPEAASRRIELLEREIRHGLPEPLIVRHLSRTSGVRSLTLKLLQPLHLVRLVRLQAALAIVLGPTADKGPFLASPVAGELRHAYRANRYGHGPAL